MAYCTLQDLITRFGRDELEQLASDGAGGIDGSRVARACEDASGEIDGYVASGGYTTPLKPVPRVIASYAADIARYRLYDHQADEAAEKRYEAAVKFLRAVADGHVLLGAKEPQSSSHEVIFEGGRQDFGGGAF